MNSIEASNFDLSCERMVTNHVIAYIWSRGSRRTISTRITLKWIDYRLNYGLFEMHYCFSPSYKYIGMLTRQEVKIKQVSSKSPPYLWCWPWDIRFKDIIYNERRRAEKVRKNYNLNLHEHHENRGCLEDRELQSFPETKRTLWYFQ